MAKHRMTMAEAREEIARLRDVAADARRSANQADANLETARRDLEREQDGRAKDRELAEVERRALVHTVHTLVTSGRVNHA